MTGAVVLNYRTADDAVRLAGQLLDAGVSPVVVVDNESGPTDLAVLEQWSHGESRDAVLLKADANGGYSRGNNIGLRYLAQRGCGRAIVCNPDIHIPMGAISELVDSMSPQDVLLAPRLVDESGLVDSNGGWWAYRWGRGELNRRKTAPSARAGRVAVFNGACFLVDLKCFMQIGLLPEDHFLYGEEADVVQRLHGKDWRWRQVDVEVVHHRGGSLGSSPSWSQRSATAHQYAAESAILLAKKYWPRWLPLVVAARVGMSLIQLAKRDPSSARAICRGVLTGISGRTARPTR